MSNRLLKHYTWLRRWLCALGLSGALAAVTAAILGLYWPPAFRIGVVAILAIAVVTAGLGVRLEVVRKQLEDAARDPLNFGRRADDVGAWRARSTPDSAAEPSTLMQVAMDDSGRPFDVGGKHVALVKVSE